MFGPLVLERPEEPLGSGVVVAVAGATHRVLDSQRLADRPAGDFAAEQVNVDGADFLRWQHGFGTPGAAPEDGDANGDDSVNAADLAVWKSQFGAAAVPAAASVPEPVAA